MNGDTAGHVSPTDAAGYYRRYYNLRSAQGAPPHHAAAGLEQQQQTRRKQPGPCADPGRQHHGGGGGAEGAAAPGTTSSSPRPPSVSLPLGRFLLTLALVSSLAVSLGVAGVYCSLRLVYKHVGDLGAALDGTANELNNLIESMKEDGKLLLKLNDELHQVQETLRHEMQVLIRTEMWLRDNDKTGLVDFALESAGGRVLSTNDTPRYEAEDSTLSFLGFTLYQLTRSNPSSILQPDTRPGACWAFRGSRGLAVVSLLGFVHLTAVSLEHIPASQAPTGLTLSAPRDFAVLALPGPVLDEHAVEVGRFVYEVGSAPLQTFSLPVKLNRSFRYVALSITSNHGHPDFTCVYRFRVHGSLDAQGHVHKRLEHETVGRN